MDVLLSSERIFFRRKVHFVKRKDKKLKKKNRRMKINDLNAFFIFFQRLLNCVTI